MTTIAEATTEAEIAVHSTPIPTDLGTAYSIRDLKLIEDVAQQAAAAAAVARETEEQGDAARHLRDIGGLLMIQPFQAAQRPYDAAIARINAALEADEITSSEAWEQRQAASQARREAMENVVYKPIDVYQETLGVSRGLFVRMQHREPALPTPEEYLRALGRDYDDDAVLEAVQEAARAKRHDCERYDAIAEAARDIRDAAIRKLLKGNRRAKRPPMSNADVARLTKVTPARVHQIHRGGR